MGALEVVGLILLFVILAVVGYRLGLKRRREVVGLVLGLVLSWVGVLVLAY